MHDNVTGKTPVKHEEPPDSRQVCLVVDGCKVTLNFPVETDCAALGEVKRMMLGGAAGT